MTAAKRYRFAIYLSSIWLICFMPVAYSAISPNDFVKNLSDRLLRELDMKENTLKGNSQLAYSIAKRIVIPEVDVQGMSRSVLGRKTWDAMTSRQKNKFTKTFTNLIMKTYSKSLINYDDDKIKVFPMHKRYIGKKRVVVKSLLLRSHGRKIKLKYRMIAKGNSWKIYDVSVSGISLLQNFRTQFTRELSRGSIDDLIDKMKRN